MATQFLGARSRQFRAGRLLAIGVSAYLLGAVASLGAQQTPAAPGAAAAPASAALAFVGVTVLDVVKGRELPNQTVLIVGDRVRTTGPVAKVKLPAGTKVVEANGKYLIPGLWDMHVHVDNRPHMYGEFIAKGITGIREMGDANADGADSFPRWRQEILAGQRVGPRTAWRPVHLHQGKPGKAGSENRTAGAALLTTLLTTDSQPLARLTTDSLSDSLRQAIRQSGAIEVSTPAEAQRAVALMKASGIPWIKLYGADMDATMAPDVFFAAAAEARRLGIAFAGHRPFSVSPMAASDSGMRSFEHVPFGLLPPCTAALWQALPPPADTSDIGYKIIRLMSGLDPTELAWHDSSSTAIERGCAALARRLARNDTWLVPTLAINGGPLSADAPPFVVQWLTLRKAFVNKLYRLGAPIMAGTDDGYGGKVSAYLHDELAYYVEGGLSPLEALRTATLNPAKYLHATDSLGSIGPGKLADLVLLDADPLADIHNTTKIRAVVANGHYYDRGTLDHLSAQTEQAAHP